MATYVELQVTSHFSFLRGASSPDELFAAAALQGHSALGVADRGSVAGLVRAWEAQKATGVRLIPGARVDLADGRALLLYPSNKAAWSRLTRLLTLGKSRAGKGGCTLGWSDVVAWNDGLIAILLPHEPNAATADHLTELRETFADRGYLGLAFRRRPDDALRLHQLSAQAAAVDVAAVAVGDILYHAPEARLLQDVVTAIREKCTVDTLGFRRERHADRHLKSPDEMERRFAAFPDAIRATTEIAARCTFDLGQLSYQYPHERVVDGLTAQGALEQLTQTAVERMFRDGVPEAYRKQIGHELTLVGELGYPRDFAERTFKQIEGFGSYGFPESHAASFAKIAYASCWMKHHHPDVFCAALLNAQPMGFYAPAQVVRDAREHGVEVRPACINASRWDCTLEPTTGRHLAVRLGLRQVRGLANGHGAAIVAARGDASFQSVEEVWRRAGVPRAAIERLAEADAFHALGEDRRQGLWKVKGLGETPLPLFAAADARETAFSPEGLEPDVSLRPLSEGREVVEDYRALQLSLRAHPLAFLRPDLTRRGIVRCADLAHIKDGRHVEVAGIILVRQKPGSAKGVLFITIEDETGIGNGILWPDRFEAQRRTIMSAAMVGMKGRVQREGLVTHVICDRIIDYGGLLAQVGQMDFPHATGRGDGARHAGSPDRGDAGWRPGPRDSYWPPHANGMDPEQVVRIKSRDFH